MPDKAASVTRALAALTSAEYIAGYSATTSPGLFRSVPKYDVELRDGRTVHLTGVAEGTAFVLGAQAVEKVTRHRAEVQAAAEAAHVAQEQLRRATERERYELAIQVAHCETCGAQPGEKCQVQNPGPPYTDKPHAPRLDAASVTVKVAQQPE
jgi:hypothetical protein